jgi:hypothetical protein
MAYLIYVLEVQSEGLAAEILVNGASAFHEPLGAARFLQTKLNPFLVPGENEIEVMLGPPPPPPDGEPAPAGNRAFKLRAFRAEWGVEGPDEALADFTYGSEPELPEQGRVSVIKLPFDAGAAHGRWAHQDARPFSPADRAAVVGVVLEAHAALAARDAAALGALTSTKREELARALDTPADELAADERAYLQGFFQAHDWKLAPIDPAALVLSPTAGGRLVQVTDASGRPPLRGVGGGKVMAMSVTVSHLAGGWRIVR